MGERIIRVHVGEKEVDVDSDKTFVFQHLGGLAVFDHIYFVYGDEDGEEGKNGCYIWNDSRIYPDALKGAEEKQAVFHKNLRSVGDSDVDAFMKHHTTDLGDTPPEEWPEQYPPASEH